MKIKFCLALLRSRWAQLLGRQCCDSTGGYQGHMWDSSLPLTGSVVTVGCNTCTLPSLSCESVSPSQQAKFFLQHEYVISSFTLCDHFVTMETILGLIKKTSKPLWCYSVWCGFDFLKVIQQCCPHLFTCMLWEIQLLHSSVICRQLEIQCKLTAAKHP